MKVITMTAYRRPQYTREVLDALAQCDGIGDWTLLPNVEPGNAEVIAAFREFKACECRLVVNERRLGLNRNTLATLMRAFHLKADHVVHLEDDTVPSPDALRYFEWGIDYLVEHDPKHTILLVSGYNKPKSEPTPEQSHHCDTRPIWTPWGWGVDRKRLVWLMANWCTRNPKCFTCNFRSQYQRTRKELFPVLSRIQISATSSAKTAAQRSGIARIIARPGWHCWNREFHFQYRRRCSAASKPDMIYPCAVGCIGQAPIFVGGNASRSGSVCSEVEMSDVTSDRWLSVEEIAAYLGIKRDTVYKWIERKQMPAHKVGSLWKFKRDEIDTWVRNGDAGDSAGSRKPR